MRSQTSGSVMAVILAILLGYSWAQGPGLRGAEEPRGGEFPVALVDLGKVFNKYKVVVERRDELQAKYQQAIESGKSLVTEIQQLQEELKKHKPGTAEHQRIAEQLQAKAKEFEAFRQQEQQKMMQELSGIYLQASERVNQEIQQYAEARGIKLVLRFSSDPIEGKTPQETLANLNRPVLYHNALDITDEILQALN
ncbi:MAG TPA: OmpH family outer membrane protein [Planctomycetaceae bacterium]|nr:OmpH family outer membrane protein [Planctomycetaceae bacterium]